MGSFLYGVFDSNPDSSAAENILVCNPLESLHRMLKSCYFVSTVSDITQELCSVSIPLVL